MQEQVVDTAAIADFVQSRFHSSAVRVWETEGCITLTPVAECELKETAGWDSYELGKDLFGKYGSGRSDLSVNYKALLKEKIRAKHRTN